MNLLIIAYYCSGIYGDFFFNNYASGINVNTIHFDMFALRA